MNIDICLLIGDHLFSVPFSVDFLARTCSFAAAGEDVDLVKFKVLVLIKGLQNNGVRNEKEVSVASV